MAKKQKKSKSLSVRRREVLEALKEAASTQDTAAGWIAHLLEGQAAPDSNEPIDEQKRAFEFLLDSVIGVAEDARVSILAKGKAATIAELFEYNEDVGSPEHALVAEALVTGVTSNELVAWAKFAKKHLGLK
jgi:hypothetical protein